MVGQCVFCSWYGIRLRRAPYLEGGPGLYHAHCARVALQSPDAADRGRAEAIFREELPRVLRARFWELNPPTRTRCPLAGLRTLSAEEFDRLCREHLAAPGDLLRPFLLARDQPNADGRESPEALDGMSGAALATQSDDQPALPAPASFQRERRPRHWRAPAAIDRDAQTVPPLITRFSEVARRRVSARIAAAEGPLRWRRKARTVAGKETEQTTD